MAHFAKVVNGIVTQVIVAEPEFFDTFIDTSPGQWIQTSYNTHGGVHYDPATGLPSQDQSKALRKNFAGIGYTYDAELDAFIRPKPFEGDVLDPETGIWISPEAPEKPDPINGKQYSYNQETKTWVLN